MKSCGKCKQTIRKYFILNCAVTKPHEELKEKSKDILD